jgi:hypothetical protein
MQKLEISARFARCGITADNLAKPSAVHIRHFLHVQDDPTFTLREKLVDTALDEDVTFPHQYFPVQLKNLDSGYCSVSDVHCAFS